MIWLSIDSNGLYKKSPVEEFDDNIKDFFMEYLNMKL